MWANEKRDFSAAWWKPFLRRLHDWIAIRPATCAEVTERLVERHDALALAWAMKCARCINLDITGISWAKISRFADLVGEIRPMKRLPSPVFTSKFCHLLLPEVFPVVENEGSGNRWLPCKHYFKHLRSLWKATPDDVYEQVISLDDRIQAKTFLRRPKDLDAPYKLRALAAARASDIPKKPK